MLPSAAGNHQGAAWLFVALLFLAGILSHVIVSSKRVGTAGRALAPFPGSCPNQATSRQNEGPSSTQGPDLDPLRGRTQWLVSPVFDLMFVSGGICFLVFWWHVFFSAVEPGYSQTSMLVLLTGAVLFTDTHFGVSFLRASGRRHRFKVHIWLPLLVLPAVAALMATSEFFVLQALRLYLSVVVYHYAHQTVWLLEQYARMNNYEHSRVRRLVMPIFIYSIASYAVLAQFTGQATSFEFLGLPVPLFGAAPALLLDSVFVITGGTAAALASSMVIDASMRSKACPMPFFCLLVFTACIFTMAGEISRILWIYVPAFLHGTQTIAEAVASCRKPDEKPVETEARKLEVNGKVSKKDAASLLTTSCLMGIFLMFAAPGLLAHFCVDARLAYPAIVLTVSLWHFGCDYAINHFNSREWLNPCA